MQSGIYRITCLINGKIYIGSSINVFKRWKRHKEDLKNNIHDNRYLQNSWNKYGKKYFDFDVIEYCEIENLLKREQYYLNYTECYLREIGYNQYKNCMHQSGIIRSKEYCEKMSISLMGNTNGKGNLNKQHLFLKRRYSDEDIKDIRTNKKSYRENAKEYSCSLRTIDKIRKRLIYKDVK